MKTKLLTLAAVAAVSLSMSAAGLEVVSVEKMDVGCTAHHPVLSPNGEKVLFTTVNHTGLKSYDFASEEAVLVDDKPGAGFDPVFSADGKEVLYRTNIVVDGLMRRNMKRANLETGVVVQVIEPTKKIAETRAVAAKSIAKNEVAYAYAKADKQAIEVTVNGLTKEINPIAAGYRYLWASVSPSSEKLLFTEIYSGVYVSNLDGTKALHLTTRAEFPCWAGNDYVVAMYTEDDGYVVTKSKVIAIEVATGKITELTGDDVLVDGVTATADKIVYTTEGGEMYLMNIKIAK